ncbi:MAG TPA: VOC family protein [Casimicrobiaceae bacterium]|nr:VOC family protein [Casimicrobiaceae bacterium]
MYDHVGLTVSNLERSRVFYAAALVPLGITELMRVENFIGFGREHPKFWLVEGEAVQPAPRTHVAFAAVSRLEVDAFHRAAIEGGGVDHGPPGLRPHYHPDYYGAFVLDPDGHNIEAVCHRPA